MSVTTSRTATRRRGVAAAVAVLALAAAPSATATAADRLSYNRDVRPILSDNCFACHGPDPKHREAGLRLDTREGALASRENGPAIVPGNADESDLVFRIESDDESLVMPPPSAHKTLTKAQRAILTRWVKEGAEYQPHWAYIPPVRAAVPALKDETAVRNPIDAFIQKELEAHTLRPAPEADRPTLLRRLSLDLTGLPPTPEEVKAFMDDHEPGAYERQVDRLLKSPHYGERMAQPWLDVARYADTVGFHGDQNQNAWAYRDYVVNAFNTNKPFDRFTVEQLAGDLLPDPTPEQLTATCFNRLNMMTREGGAQPKEYLAKSQADRIRTVGLAWLGSTFACAECHDHKFDPITTKDFYSLGAFFADVKQWGVYADYGYTPNPDLRGYNNDSPFPPEAVVPSAALERRRAGKVAERDRLVSESKLDPQALAAWTDELRAFLKGHPDGWETPAPEAELGAPTPRPRAKAKDDAKPKPDAPRPTIADDGRIVLPAGPPAPLVIDLDPTPGGLAAVRVELLPDPAHGGKIVRTGDSTALSVAIERIGPDGEPAPLAVRHAQANRWSPRYDSGFEIIGVHRGWTTAPGAATEPHVAVFTLDRPVRLGEDDRLRVKLSDSAVGAVRVSVSPLAPPDLETPALADNLAARLDDPAAAAALHLRSTGADAERFAKLRGVESAILACRGGKTPVMVTQRTEKPLVTRVLARGNWMDESGEIVAPSTPGFLPKPPSPEGATLTRLDLARWLCSPENPLTARTVVNRLWRQFFGNGLSAQVDDLGAQGEPPSHPELLDWLAVEFRERGWDVRAVVRLIVTSHTYRQAAGPRPELHESDPNGRLLASQNPRRLDAEFIRDNALAVAGLLDRELGGPPAFPYQPADYYEGLQFPDRNYVADRGASQYRRGIYSHWQRTFLHPMLANFDAPSREDCLALRTSANSPQQALTLLNDPSFVEAARAWGARLLGDATLKDDGARIDRAFAQALARPPKDAERASLLAFLDAMRREYAARPEDAAKLLGVGYAPKPEGDAVELAAWACACRVILNLHETITRY
jgi:mono/diheme cytochrome c family protein